MTLAQRLAPIKAYLVDLDGVVFRGREPLPGGPQFFHILRQRGLSFMLLTNNSSLTEERCVERLASIGVDVTPQEVMTSGKVAADYITNMAGPGARVYAIGEPGFQTTLERAGCVLTETDPDYVVVGLDRSFTYEKLLIASRAVAAGAHFLGTNPDPAIPWQGGFIPGAGALQAAVAACTGVEPRTLGKPLPDMLFLAMDRLGVKTTETAMIGDRLDTDIAAGKAADVTTILVLSGATSSQDLDKASSQPDMVFADLAEIARVLDGEGPRS